LARQGIEHADAPHPLALLRLRRERPRRRCAAEQSDELAAFQLIEVHFIPASPGPDVGYRIGGDQSAGWNKEAPPKQG
jgi:hypothetical protein